MHLGFVGLHKLAIEIVKHELGLHERVVVVNYQLYSCLVLATRAGLLLQSFDIPIHLGDAGVTMDGTQVGTCVKVQTLDVDLIHANLLVVHDFLKIYDGLVR